MKKIIITLMLLFSCLNIAQADNSMQVSYEQILMSKTPTWKIMPAKFLVEDDYNGYLKNADTFYGDLLKELNKQKALNTVNSKLNAKYLDLCKKCFDNMYNNKTSPKINIDNSEYSLLSEFTKVSVAFVNQMLSNEKISILVLRSFSYDYKKYINSKYLKNKNNMKNNKEIISAIENEIDSVNLIYKYLLKNSNYIEYNETISNDEFKQLFEDIKNDLELLSKEIYNYSYSYEQKKYDNWAIRNNKKKLVGRLSDAVYSPYFQVKNGLYAHGAQFDYPLQVVQSLPNGVLLSGNVGLGGMNMKTIFLVTSKKYVDGQWLNEPIVAEYKGTYDYTTVLGVNKRVYKFYRYGKNEIDNNFKIPNETLYFFKPY